MTFSPVSSVSLHHYLTCHSSSLTSIACVAGNALTWSDHYRIETEDETFQDGERHLLSGQSSSADYFCILTVIDSLLNTSVFIYLGTLMPCKLNSSTSSLARAYPPSRDHRVRAQHRIPCTVEAIPPRRLHPRFPPSPFPSRDSSRNSRFARSQAISLRWMVRQIFTSSFLNVSVLTRVVRTGLDRLELVQFTMLFSLSTRCLKTGRYSEASSYRSFSSSR